MRIAIWTGNYQYWGSVDPRHLWDRGSPQMGGSEITALGIAWQLARMGHQVLLGCQTNFPRTYAKNLRICPLDVFIPAVFAAAQDVLVSWDEPTIFRNSLEHIPLKVIAYELNHTVGGVFTHVIDKYFHPSRWHADRYVKEFGIPVDKQVIGLTNALPAELPKMLTPDPRRHPYVLWGSSPDRGLHHLLRIWPRVHKAVPEAELHIYYNMEKWLNFVQEGLRQGVQYDTTSRAQEIMSVLPPLLQEGGVVYHGGVSHIEFVTALLNGTVLAYPCDPVAPTECFSMVMLEAISVGLPVLATDADAFPELWGPFEGVTLLPLPVDDDLWTDAIVRELSCPHPRGEEAVPPEYTTEYVCAGWEVELRE